MKKILIESELNHLLHQQDSFLKRSDVRIFTAGSSDELLRIHRKERVDLIVTPVDLPGMGMELISVNLRSDVLTKSVRLVLIAPNNRIAIESCSRCKPDAVVLRPVYPQVLLARCQQLLGVDWRVNYRVLITVSVNGLMGDEKFVCRSRDISSSGLLIETDKKLALESRLTCSFTLPGEVRIQADGEVVRMAGNALAAPYLYGIKFIDISSEAHNALENFIDNLTIERAS